MTTLPRRNTPLHVAAILADGSPPCHIRAGHAELVALRVLHHDPVLTHLVDGLLLGRAEPDQPVDLGGHPGGAALRWHLGTDLKVEVHPVLHRLGLGDPLEEDPDPLPVRVDDGTLVVPPVFRHPELAQEVVPRGVPGRRGLHDVPECRGPELRLRGRVGAVQHHLQRGRHRGSSS
jgi:hypothetical protein